MAIASPKKVVRHSALGACPDSVIETRAVIATLKKDVRLSALGACPDSVSETRTATRERLSAFCSVS